MLGYDQGLLCAGPILQACHLMGGAFGSGLCPIDPTLALSNRVVDRCPEHSEFGEDQAMIVMIAILYIKI